MVGWPAGGDTDAAARIYAEQLSIALRQPVVVDNRPGASGTIAASAVGWATPGVVAGHIKNGTLLPLAVAQAQRISLLPEVRAKLAAMNTEPVGGAPAALAAQIEADTQIYQRLVPAMGLRPE